MAESNLSAHLGNRKLWAKRLRLECLGNFHAIVTGFFALNEIDRQLELAIGNVDENLHIHVAIFVSESRARKK